MAQAALSHGRGTHVPPRAYSMLCGDGQLTLRRDGGGTSGSIRMAVQARDRVRGDAGGLELFELLEGIRLQALRVRALALPLHEVRVRILLVSHVRDIPRRWRFPRLLHKSIFRYAEINANIILLLGQLYFACFHNFPR